MSNVFELKTFICFIVAGMCFLSFSCRDKSSQGRYFVKGPKMDTWKVLEDENGDTVFLKKLKRPLLVIKYSKLNCNTCVDSLLSSLKRIKKDIPHAFFTDYEYDRDLYLFKRINNIKSKVYKTKYKTSIDSLNMPYVYVLDEDLSQKSVFIPKKENILDFDNYLSEISNFYWE
ncbi:hypothetical protein [Flavisericum labens]|uniref:hypothetical protein n=1 Tax=Flavisericum labens TaxID=3377112 RepID=UPI00387B653E